MTDSVKLKEDPFNFNRYQSLSEYLTYHEASAEAIQYARLQESGGRIVVNDYTVYVFPLNSYATKEETQQLLRLQVVKFLRTNTPETINEIDAFVLPGEDGAAVQIAMETPNPMECAKVLEVLAQSMSDEVNMNLYKIYQENKDQWKWEEEDEV